MKMENKLELIERLIKEGKITFAEALVLNETEKEIVAQPYPVYPQPIYPQPTYPQPTYPYPKPINPPWVVYGSGGTGSPIPPMPNATSWTSSTNNNATNCLNWSVKEGARA